MKVKKSSLCAKFLLVIVFAAFTFGCDNNSNQSNSTSDCDTTYQHNKPYDEQNDYTIGYDKGKLNKNGGSSVCDPYKNEKVEGRPGYVTDGEHIRLPYSDCFCKGFEAGYNSK